MTNEFGFQERKLVAEIKKTAKIGNEVSAFFNVTCIDDVSKILSVFSSYRVELPLIK